MDRRKEEGEDNKKRQGGRRSKYGEGKEGRTINEERNRRREERKEMGGRRERE